MQKDTDNSSSQAGKRKQPQADAQQLRNQIQNNEILVPKKIAASQHLAQPTQASKQEKSQSNTENLQESSAKKSSKSLGEQI